MLLLLHGLWKNQLNAKKFGLVKITNPFLGVDGIVIKELLKIRLLVLVMVTV